MADGVELALLFDFAAVADDLELELNFPAVEEVLAVVLLDFEDFPEEDECEDVVLAEFLLIGVLCLEEGGGSEVFPGDFAEPRPPLPLPLLEFVSLSLLEEAAPLPATVADVEGARVTVVGLEVEAEAVVDVEFVLRSDM